MSRALSMSSLLAVFAWSAIALAQDRRVGIRIVGKGDALIRDRVGQVLVKHGFKLASHQQVEAAARSMKRGFSSGRDLAAIAQKLNLTAIVTGKVNAPAGKALLFVRSGASGAIKAKAGYSVKGGANKLADTVLKTLWSRIGAGLENASGGGGKGGAVAARAPRGDASDPPVADEEEEAKVDSSDAEEDAEASAADDESEDDAEGDDGDKADKAVATVRRKAKVRRTADGADGEGSQFPALSLEVGPRFTSRDLSYSGNAGTAILPFKVTGRTAMGFGAVWFPAAHSTTSFVSNLGVVVNGEYVSTFVSKTGDAQEYPTRGSDYFGGARYRLPLGAFEPSLTAGMGRHAFVFASGPTSPRADIAVPDVIYNYLRFAANGNLHVHDAISLSLGLGYRAVLSPGDKANQIKSAEYFPKTSVSAFDLGASVGYRLHPLMEARLGYDLRRYSFTTKAAATDPVAATGATDTYHSLWVSVALVVDGMGGGARRGSAPPAGTVSAEGDEE